MRSRQASSKPLARVRRGATVTVCDRRTPIARLIPLEGDTGELEVREPIETRALPTAPGIKLKKRVDVLALLRADRDQR